MPQTMNLVDDCLYLLRIIFDCADDAHGIVEPSDVCNFRGIEIIYPLAGRTIHQVVGWVLVRPCSNPARGFHYLEDRVGPHRVVGKHGYTATAGIQASRQLGRINHVLRNVGRIVEINAFVKDHVIARLASAGSIGRIKNGAVVADVIEQPVADGRSARDQRQEAGKGIGVGRCASVGVGDAVARQFG